MTGSVIAMTYAGAVSDLCNELGLQPSVFYQWQRQASRTLPGAFQPST
jgi:transposase-like protein